MDYLGLKKKDLAILRELDLNVRASYSKIGKKTHLSKEVAQYRIKKLEEKNIITGYWAVINKGFSYAYKILIKNRNLTQEKKQQFIRYVANEKTASWFANTEGNFDYVITVFADNDEYFVKFANSLLEKYGSFFQERHILKILNAGITNEKYLYPQNKFIYNYKIDIYSNIKVEDETDEKILTEISLNSRAKMTEIAKKVNLTSEAVAYRFNNMKKKGLIVGLKPRLNFEKLGLSYYHLFVALQNQEKKKEIISYYTIHCDSNAILEHLGFYDLHIEFVIQRDKIQDVMDDFTSKFGAFVNSYELLRIRKEHVISMMK